MAMVIMNDWIPSQVRKWLCYIKLSYSWWDTCWDTARPSTRALGSLAIRSKLPISQILEMKGWVCNPAQ